ncbi:acyltransferase [uncultured Ruegeria sp.]|uniref:acyltransferase family protein n=1 Tax=uncultured Ruegeria sp. TaxID=259304 RepID=UPI00260F0B2E|nr:acyltransferase [uncultured Ruegeria sp.]
MATNQKTQRAHGLDALRGIAASGVVCMHAIYIHPLGVEFFGWHVGYLAMGVPLFFIISAFSMSLAYPNGVKANRGWVYALRRFLRIAPLFYLMLFLWYRKGSPVEFDTLLRNFTFTFGFVPEDQYSLVPAGWSLGVEAIFYLIFPFFWVWRNIWGALVLFLASCIGWAIVNLSGSSEVPHGFYWHSFFTNAPYFAFGLLGWSIYQEVKPSWERPVGLATLAAGLSILTLMFLYGPYPDASTNPISLIFILGWGLGFGCLALSQALYPVTFFVNRFTEFLGKISYSLYLMHPFLIYKSELTRQAAALTSNPNLVVPIVSAITLIAAIPIATILYYLIERPFIRLARFLTKPKSTQDPRPSSAAQV